MSLDEVSELSDGTMASLFSGEVRGACRPSSCSTRLATCQSDSAKRLTAAASLGETPLAAATIWASMKSSGRCRRVASSFAEEDEGDDDEVAADDIANERSASLPTRRASDQQQQRR